jgi:cell wall assembly regulator SMI1
LNEILLKEQILYLLQTVPRAPEYNLPLGATDDNISEFERRMDLHLPDELKMWLKISNGPCIGPGGIYGILPAIDYLLIEVKLNIFPEWQQYKWFPIAGDGNGNYYILDGNINCSGYHPIYFIDHEIDIYKPRYIVASNIWTFLYFLLQNEIDWENNKKMHWPQEKDYVISIDPYIENIDISVPFPWSN